jgi:iron complex transport system substrate-binding protein
MPLSRRSLLGSLAVAAVGAPVLAACGADATPVAQPGEAASTPSVGPEAGALPVTVTHKYGETTVSSAPTRIVCVGLKDQDDLLALGLVPVGASKWLELGQGGVIGPWAEKALAGRPAPQALDTANGIAFEAIAALTPDLILALYSGLTKEEYTKLTAIAPVIAPPKDYVDYGIPWDVEAETVGRAVGQPARMAELVAASKKAVSDAAAAHPDFAGLTSLVATPYEGIYVYGEQDPRTRLMGELGFVLPKGFAAALGDAGNTFGGNVSAERSDLLDVDALICFADQGAEQAKIETKVFQQFTVAKEDRVVWLRPTDKATDPFSFLTVLSLPYLLENFVDRVVAAVDGDPATSSEQAA